MWSYGGFGKYLAYGAALALPFLGEGCATTTGNAANPILREYNAFEDIQKRWDSETNSLTRRFQEEKDEDSKAALAIYLKRELSQLHLMERDMLDGSYNARNPTPKPLQQYYLHGVQRRIASMEAMLLSTQEIPK